MLRPAAVAGSWYPAAPDELAREVDAYLAEASPGEPLGGRLIALIAPHAGLMYSGPVAAHAYRHLRERPIDIVVLVGPSHFIAFDGVALYGRGAFASPLGAVQIDDAFGRELLAATSVVHENPGPHRREHSLEMQLPFVRRVAPRATIVPLLVGDQSADTARELGRALAQISTSRSVVLIASTDLSHYEDARTAHRLDAIVIEQVRRFDPERLEAALQANPYHACGGGPTVAVMRAARALGANRGLILRYGDSGDVSGDKTSVVGYLAAALIADDRPL